MRILSPMASIARGSVAGLTFLANSYHQIVIRQKTSPVNPKTVNQETMRTCFANAANQWKGLTAAQRTGWEDYAATVKIPGPLGDYYTSGRNLFMGNLGLVYYINSRSLDTIVVSLAPPTTNGVPAWSNVQFNAPTSSGTGFSIHLGNDSGDAMNYFITHSMGFDPSRNNYKGPFDSSTAVSDEIADSATDDIDFLGLTVDTKYFVRIKGVTVSGPHRQTFPVIVSGLASTVI